MNTNENTTPTTEKKGKHKSELVEKETTQLMDLQLVSTLLGEETSESLSLIDNSALLLYNSMHSQIENVETNEYRKLSFEQTQNVAMLAKELRETLRLKLDVAKTKMTVLKAMRSMK